MYGLNPYYVTKSQLNSLDFVLSRLFMNLFKTNNMDIVKYCQYCFGFEVPSELWVKRVNKLNQKIAKYNNMFVARFSQLLMLVLQTTLLVKFI